MTTLYRIIIVISALILSSTTVSYAQSAGHSHDETHAESHMMLMTILKHGKQEELDNFLISHRDAQWLQEEDTRASITNALMHEAQECNEDIIMSLAENNIILSSKTVGSPYHFLGYMDSTDKIVECIDIFIRAGIDINATDSEGKTALVHILYSHHMDTLFTLEKLLDNGADPTIRSEQGLDLLHYSLLMHSLYAGLIPDDEQQSDDYPFTHEAKRMMDLTKQVNFLFTQHYLSK